MGYLDNYFVKTVFEVIYSINGKFIVYTLKEAVTEKPQWKT